MQDTTPQDVTPDAQNDVAPDWRTEWAVEVTWLNWKKAGAKGPTSQYGPFETEEHRDRFLDQQRRDREVTATRVLTRRAAYTPWTASGAAEPTTEEEREALLAALYEQIAGRPVPSDADDR